MTVSEGFGGIRATGMTKSNADWGRLGDPSGDCGGGDAMVAAPNRVTAKVKKPLLRLEG